MHAGDYIFILLIALVCSVFAYFSIAGASSIWLRGNRPETSPSTKYQITLRILSCLVLVSSFLICLSLLKTSSSIVPSAHGMEFKLSLLGFAMMTAAWWVICRKPRDPRFAKFEKIGAHSGCSNQHNSIRTSSQSPSSTNKKRADSLGKIKLPTLIEQTKHRPHSVKNQLSRDSSKVKPISPEEAHIIEKKHVTEMVSPPT